jgi:hypothetical protein
MEKQERSPALQGIDLCLLVKKKNKLNISNITVFDLKFLCMREYLPFSNENM